MSTLLRTHSVTFENTAGLFITVRLHHGLMAYLHNVNVVGYTYVTAICGLNYQCVCVWFALLQRPCRRHVIEVDQWAIFGIKHYLVLAICHIVICCWHVNLRDI